LSLKRFIMLNTEKLFTVAGTATNPDGTTKVRFANDLVARIKILNKAGCTNLELVELPRPMTKLEAITYLQGLGTITGDAAFVLEGKAAEKSKVAKKSEVKVIATKPSIASIRARKPKAADVEAVALLASVMSNIVRDKGEDQVEA